MGFCNAVVCRRNIVFALCKRLVRVQWKVRKKFVLVKISVGTGPRVFQFRLIEIAKLL